MDKSGVEQGFDFTYSAKEQDEIKRIRQKYETPEENGMDKLRKLDEAVTKKATKASVTLGTLGALIMGTGMSLILTDLGTVFGMQGMACITIGILIGLVGIVLVALAYPVYSIKLKKEREKIAPEILKLTEELMR